MWYTVTVKTISYFCGVDMSFFCSANLSDGAVLAPMAGFTDDVFRSLCAENGAIITISEMVSARAVTLGDLKSNELCRNYSGLSPYGIQLFGSRPEDFKIASERLMQFSPDFYDINCGCPAPKITGSGGGSSLLRNPGLIGEIVSVVKSTSKLPVSVKLRTGIEGEPAAIAAAVSAEKAGASLITVHGRYQRQGYRPPVDYNIAAEVKKNILIPMLYNGDIKDAKTARLAIEKTGADGVMIGRASMGNPFVFRLSPNGEQAPLTERVDMLLRHASLIFDRYGKNGLVAFRTHITHYIKGFRDAASLRKEAVNVSSMDDIKYIVDRLSSISLE